MPCNVGNGWTWASKICKCHRVGGFHLGWALLPSGSDTCTSRVWDAWEGHTCSMSCTAILRQPPGSSAPASVQTVPSTAGRLREGHRLVMREGHHLMQKGHSSPALHSRSLGLGMLSSATAYCHSFCLCFCSSGMKTVAKAIPDQG